MLRLIIFTFFLSMAATKDYFAPSLFLNHGGGPNPVLRQKNNIEIGDSLLNVTNYVELDKLKAIILITAHREEDVVTISSGKKHELVYDYYNFPPISYTFKYDAPGAPNLAERIHEAFKKAGIQSALDDQRGWDHGVFIPMMLIRPQADIPIVQISCLKDQNARDHFEIGKVLYEFRKEGVAIFGSGLSYHNMMEFKKVFKNVKAESVIANAKFDGFLNDVCLGEEENRERIIDWQEIDEAYYCHPLGKAEHLMPLIVNVGAGGTKPARKIFDSMFLNKFRLSGFLWDQP